MDPSEGFAPIERADARILILGSLPGRRSLAEGEYYAHPQNAFWRIMAEILGIRGAYEERAAQLIANHIALWDVLASSVRPGSMDADISLERARANDFSTFFAGHPGLRTIAFNGKKAEQLFTRLAADAITDNSLRLIGLPSTSPAYAAMPFSGKLAAWRAAVGRAALQQ